MIALSLVLAIAAIAYLVGAWQRASAPPSGVGRLTEVEQRLAELERRAAAAAALSLPLSEPGDDRAPCRPVSLCRLDKLSTVSHYEALASQVADERRRSALASVGQLGGDRGAGLRLVWSAGVGTAAADGRRG